MTQCHGHFEPLLLSMKKTENTVFFPSRISRKSQLGIDMRTALVLCPAHTAYLSLVASIHSLFPHK